MEDVKNYFVTIFKRFFGITLIIAICLISNFNFNNSSQMLFAQSTFKSERLENAIISYVKSINKCESEVEINQNVKEQTFSQTGVKATINHKGDLTGLCKVNIDFLLELNNKLELVRSQEVRIKVDLFANVPVATRFIPKDDIISSQDVEIRRANVTNIDPNTVIELNEAFGTKSRNGIAKGNVVKYSDLIVSSAVTVQKGDRVKLFHYVGGICIRTDGFALEKGSVGSVIKVKNNDKTLYGFIADDGNVIIENKQALEKN